MATGEIICKVNIPLSKSSFYEGLSTDTADTNVDNINKTISDKLYFMLCRKKIQEN